MQKQTEVLARDCHFIEIDLHRTGQHVVSIADWRAAQLKPYDYLICISRWPQRSRFTLHAVPLRQRLPHIRIPLMEPDPDIVLDVQAVVKQVYIGGCGFPFIGDLYAQPLPVVPIARQRLQRSNFTILKHGKGRMIFSRNYNPHCNRPDCY